MSAQDLISNVGSDDFILVDGRYSFNPDEFRDTEVLYTGVGRGSV
jgi:hypothetical protein